MPGCAAVGCSNNQRKGYLLKSFPRDPFRRKVWASKVMRANWVPTNYSYLCEVHFDKDQWEKVRVDGKRKLKWNAVPTLFPHLQSTINREHCKQTKPSRKKQRTKHSSEVDDVDNSFLDGTAVNGDVFKNVTPFTDISKHFVSENLQKQPWDANVKISELELEVKNFREKVWTFGIEKEIQKNCVET